MTALLIWTALAGILAQPRCSIGTTLSLSPSVPTALLTRATGEQRSVPVPEDYYYSALRASGTLDVPAHRFLVLKGTGPGADDAVGRHVWVVPWGYDASCDPLVWDEPTWVPARDESVFLVSAHYPLAGSEEIVIHVLGGHAPYPQAFARGRTDSEQAEWLTPQEYLRLLEALPIPTRQMHPARQVRDIELVFETGDARWSRVFPGSEILSRARAFRTRSMPPFR